MAAGGEVVGAKGVRAHGDNRPGSASDEVGIVVQPRLLHHARALAFEVMLDAFEGIVGYREACAGGHQHEAGDQIGSLQRHFKHHGPTEGVAHHHQWARNLLNLAHDPLGHVRGTLKRLTVGVPGQGHRESTLKPCELWPPRCRGATGAVDEHGAGRVYEIGVVGHAADGIPLVPSSVVAPLLIAVDFDGTITLRDTLHVIVDAHGRPGLWDQIEPALRSGEMTVEEAMQTQFATVTAAHDDVVALVRDQAGTRPGFADLVAFAEAGGHRLVVMSAGFRCVIDEVLGDLGLRHLEVVANDAIFTTGGCTLVWGDHRGETCEICGRRCKRHAIRERHGDERLIYVGDGISDRCASLLADQVFARDGLAEWLVQEGVPFVPYEDFHDVIRVLRTDPAVAEAA